jgi:outer membrane protein TolC
MMRPILGWGPVGMPATFLAACLAASGVARAAEPKPLPSTADVESLGAGWPSQKPLPLEEFQPIPVEQLGNLDLESAVQLSDRRNPVVRQSYEELVATQNALGAAYATWWPVINATLNGGMYGETAFYNYPGALTGVGAPADGNPYASQRGFSGSYFQSLSQFDIAWNVFDPARTPSIWKNKYLVRQSVDSYVIARRDNRLRTKEAYIQLQRSVAKIETGRDLVDNDQRLLTLAKSRVRFGVASQLDVAKQITVLKSDQVNLVNAIGTAEEAQADLAERLNEVKAAQILLSQELAPLGVWSASLEDTIQSALQYRKVIEQQLTEVKVNEAQAQIDLSIYRPTIALVNTLYWNKGVGYTSIGPPWVSEARSDLWNGSTLLQITFTGFDGGQARMTAAASRRRARAAEAGFQQAVNQVRRDVQAFYAQVKQGREAVVLASQRANAASEALRLQSLRFNAGYGNITDVVQAQQDLTGAVSDYIDQLADYNISLVSLSRASGLTYQEDPSLLQEIGTPLSKLRIPRLTPVSKPSFPGS